jgi:hypothetical protein
VLKDRSATEAAKMKTHKQHRLLIAGLLIFCAQGAAAAAPEPAHCGDYMNDRAALKKAPQAARRLSAHVLTVKYEGGIKRFVDEPPYQAAFGGAHWYYCGHVPALQAHLIGKNDEDVFSGVLMLSESGKLVDAGTTVYPSPDGKWFLAERQVSGEDGSEWLVAERSGKALWDGYAGVLESVAATPGTEAVPYVVTTFEQPHWTDDGLLHAKAVCTAPPQAVGIATFVSEHGTWRWKSDLQCSAASMP